MKNKIIALFTISLMILSGSIIVGAADYTNDETVDQNMVAKTISFSQPTRQISTENNDYFTIDIPECNGAFDEAGNPAISSYTDVTYLPAFIKNVKVDVQPSENAEVKTITFQGKIQPSPVPIPKVANMANVNIMDAESGVYYQGETYKENPVVYRIGAGRDIDFNLATRVTTEILSLGGLTYDEVNDETTGEFVSSYDLGITWENGEKTLSPDGLPDLYDMVIITPDYFVKQLQPLVAHKNQMGVPTYIKTLDEIYDEYLDDAYDEPEAMKFYIVDAVEKYGIKYVLFVGGLNSYINAKDRDGPNIGITDWHCPVRYVNFWAEGTGGVHDPGLTSDWYFGCIYKYSALDGCWMYDSWDYDEQGVSDGFYGVIGNTPYGVNQDNMPESLDPDLAVGRISARNKIEVKIAVDKIIKYERPSPKPWYNRCAWLGGDSFGGMEGEKANAMANDFMEPYGFEPIFLWASHQETGGLLPDSQGFISTVNSGVGFVEFEGHGNPYVWATYGKIEKHIDKIASYQDFPKLINRDKLPLIIVGGCHNGQFNVTVMKTLFSMDLGTDYYYWTHGVPVPRGFSEWLIFKIGGGAVGSTGCTGLGYGYLGQVGLSSEMEAFFFKFVGEQGVDIFGPAQVNAMSWWVDHGAGGPYGDVPMKCLLEWQYFGDPSLKLGGY